MENLICNVELNGKEVKAQLNRNFTYEGFNGNTDVSEDVVKQTAQQIYDEVKRQDKKNWSYWISIKADFKDDYLKGLIDDDYSTEFMPVMDWNFYKMNDYEYPYGIKDEVVEYDKDEIEYYILNEYGELYKNYCDSFYQNWVEEKLDEMGFDELCEEKGIEVEIDFCYDDIEVLYGGDDFLFKINARLSYYDRDDNE